jgi:hypothetical protein
MARSRLAFALVAVLAGCALACDALLGLGGYQEVDPTDSGQDVAPEVGGDVTDEVMDSSTTPDASDAADALDVSDGDGGFTVPPFDGPIDGPALTLLWARWPMPNPDAATAPLIDGSPPLPNPMAYDAGADSGTAFDVVTMLTWTRQTFQAATFDAAVQACMGVPGTGWHVPTRIQVVSLIDFTQPLGGPTIDPVTFPSTPASLFWTSSQVPVDAATPLYWVVDFGTGLVRQTTAASNVRCVKEGP